MTDFRLQQPTRVPVVSGYYSNAHGQILLQYERLMINGNSVSFAKLEKIADSYSSVTLQLPSS